MPPTSRPFAVQVPKTAELVAGNIRRRIVTGELHQGEVLPRESTLLEDFSVSRPTLREAFRILESEGLISVRRGAHGGARVLEPSSDVSARYCGLVLQHRGTTLSDVLSARVEVEAPAARTLAARRDRKASAAALAHRLENPDVDSPAHFHEFNALVVELTQSQTLILITAVLEHISRQATLSYAGRIGDTADNARLARRAHRSRLKLIEIIGTGDADGAEAHWRAHLAEAGRELVSGAGDSVLGLFP